MKPDNSFSKAAKSILFVLCLAVCVSQADAEVKIESVSQTVGVTGKNMEITLTGQGFTENTKVMMPDYSNRKAIIGSVDTPNFTLSVFISGNYAYMTAQDGGLYIIDVSNPKNPKIIGSIDVNGSVFVSDNYAYVVNSSDEFQIIDISNPKSPQIIGKGIESTGYTHIFVSGNYAYMTDDSGLKMIDVSNPKNPKTIGTLDVHGDIFVSGKYAYVADADKGLQIIDVSNIRNPIILGIADIYGGRIFVSGNYAYVYEGNDAGFRIVDISSPESP